MDIAQGFNTFLLQAQHDLWIESFRWSQNFKNKTPRSPQTSRSHKEIGDRVWMLEVESAEGSVVGVDLECLTQRKILKTPEWLAERFKVKSEARPREVLQEWSEREAAFKSLYPNNQAVVLSDFERKSQDELVVCGVRVSVRSAWFEDWVVSLARRAL